MDESVPAKNFVKDPMQMKALEKLVISALFNPDKEAREYTIDFLADILEGRLVSGYAKENKIYLKQRIPKSSETMLLYICDVPREYTQEDVLSNDFKV